MSKTKIVIIGGGFGGVFAAKNLMKYGRKLIDIEIINNTNYFVFQPFLPEVAAGVISAADAVVPLREMLPGVQVRQADVIGIDIEAGRVDLVQGAGRLDNHTNFDHLVLAVGQSVSVDRVPGLGDHGFTMKNLDDAFKLRGQVLHCMELADVTTRSELKRRYLTFVVVGGGFSGVETIGEVEELVSRSLKLYPNIKREEIRFHLIEFGDRILRELPDKLANYAVTKLKKRGIEIRLNTALKAVTIGDAVLSGDEIIPCSTVVATVGSTPSRLMQKIGLPLERGKLVVDANLRAGAHKNVWALGDAALIPLGEAGEFAPPTAQFAVREADVLAHNIVRSISDKPLRKFSYKSEGALASIGGRKGVGVVKGIMVKGFLGWIVWRAYYLSILPGMAAKVRVMVNWLLDGLIQRNTVQTRKRDTSGTRIVHYRKGEILFSNGMHYDGLYVLLEGRASLKIGDTTRDFYPGDFFGEKTMLAGIRARGISRIEEDSKLLVLERVDFFALNDALPFWKDQFKPAKTPKLDDL